MENLTCFYKDTVAMFSKMSKCIHLASTQWNIWSAELQCEVNDFCLQMRQIMFTVSLYAFAV